MESTLTRRNFVKWGTAAAGATALAGFTGCAPQEESPNLSETGASPQPLTPMSTPVRAVEGEKGVWLTGGCHHSCNNGAGRCLLKVYVEDGVPLRVRTDEWGSDDISVPQHRACARGRAQLKEKFSPARVKYPMKRKGWSPDNPNGEMRGRDEWERISWDEALDYIADEIKKSIDNYGPESVLAVTQTAGHNCMYDPHYQVFQKLGCITSVKGMVSMGSWVLPELLMTGGCGNGPDGLTFAKTELHVMFGCNHAHNKCGVTQYQLQNAKDAGAEFIMIDPWYNATAQAFADDWIPITPGTDTALMLGIAYHWIENGTYDQEYLDKYCVGFDADHMPEGIDPKENFKDYILGTYDNEPKTPEWASKICSVPPARIRSLAEKIANTDKVGFFAGMTTSKIPAGEMWCQVFYSVALMHGKIGVEGHYMSSYGFAEMQGGFVTQATLTTGGAGIYPEKVAPATRPVPTTAACYDFDLFTEEDMDLPLLEYSELWETIITGEYGRDCWPGGKRKADIHVLAIPGWRNMLNSQPGTMRGIEAFRKLDFVYMSDPMFTGTAKYCDIVLPECTFWEEDDTEVAWTWTGDTMCWQDHIMDPLYESKPDNYIAAGLCERLGIDPVEVDPMTKAEKTFASCAGAKALVDRATMEYKPLMTFTQEDIDELGVEGLPQEGVVAYKDFIKEGIFKTPRTEGDKVGSIPFKAFYENPEEAPLFTKSGKFEIYCSEIPRIVNKVGFSQLSGIGKWQYSDYQGQGAQTEEYPLLLMTPHTIARAHNVFASVPSLREAFPQACWMSEVDAADRNIQDGDRVLMTSPAGKVLRYAKVVPGLIPGAVLLEDGGNLDIDEETGIDKGGCPNVLQDLPASGAFVQTWNGTILQVEKYDGPLQIEADKYVTLSVPDLG